LAAVSCADAVPDIVSRNNTTNSEIAECRLQISDLDLQIADLDFNGIAERRLQIADFDFKNIADLKLQTCRFRVHFRIGEYGASQADRYLESESTVGDLQSAFCDLQFH
jgi:hypothetical protein